MFTRAGPRGVAIGRVRARGSGVDRMRVSRVLEAADLRPRGLPDPAILCVRSLRARLPTGAVDEWERGVRASLDRLRVSAARPAHEPVPAAAQAVVFADEAELLACLAREACRGTLDQGWWWRGLGLNPSTVESVAVTWIAAAEYVPAALSHLAAANGLTDFARLLDGEAVRALLRAVVYHFGLVELARVLEVTPTGRTSVRPVETSATPDGTPRPEAVVPWLMHAPEATDPRLDPPRQLLAGVGLLLQRAPATVRSPAFALTVGDWYATATAPVVRIIGARPLGADPDGPQSHASRHHSALEFDPGGQSGIASVEAVGAAGGTPLGPPSTSHGSVPNAQRVETPPAAAAPGVAEWPSAPEQGGTREHLTAAQPQTTVDPTWWTPPPPELHARMSTRIETQVGGIFFLVNLALALDLYADFTRPATPGLPLAIWDFLAIFGRRLVGRRAPEDPIWATLADLSGGPLELRAPWARWVAWRMSFLRTELRRGLQLPGDADLGAIVCLHAARLAIGPTHLTVHMSLVDHPIAIRLAGLDRDPGWVPAAGRFIAFDFAV